MEAGLETTPASHPPSAVFAELTTVRLVRAIDVEGRTLPADALGTVVAAYADRAGYEVEFDHPFHAVVTLDGDALAT